MNSRIQIFILLFISLFTGGCNQTKDRMNKPSSTITISGAFALYPLATRWAKEYRRNHPHTKIDISAGGAGKGMMDALSGMVDLGMVSRPITKEEISKGCWFIAVARDAVIPTINSHSPVLDSVKTHGLTKQHFTDIFVYEKITSWDQIFALKKTIRINAYTRSDACGTAQMWGEFLGAGQEELQGTAVFGDPGIASAIRNDLNAVGYNSIIYVYDIQSGQLFNGIEIIPIDLNGNRKIDSAENFYHTLDELTTAIKNEKYPSPPARNLYFVSRGRPADTAISEFLEWILTEGQKFVTEAGYIPLPEHYLNTQLKLIR